MDIIMIIMAISFHNRWPYRKKTLSLPTIKMITPQIPTKYEKPHTFIHADAPARDGQR